MNKRATGTRFEEIAAGYLREQGVVILEKNYRCRMGEVDLIARDGRYLVFAEVKYRCTEGTGSAAEAVDHRKQRIISRVAGFYLMTHFKSADIPCRFDVVAVDGAEAEEEIRWYKNAFEYCP